MRIVYIITKADIGGAQTHVRDLCTYFRNKGHEVCVVSSGAGWLKEEVVKSGCQFIESIHLSNTFNPLKVLVSMREVWKIVQNFKPDLVHCHSSAAGLVGRLAIRNRVRTIYTAHGWGFSEGASRVQKFFSLCGEKIASRYAEKIICVSRFVKNEALLHHIAQDNKLKVVYNGVAMENMPQKKIYSGRKMVFVGRLASPKLPELFVESIEGVKNMVSELSVEIIGDGPKRQNVEEKIENCGLQSTIMISGNLQHIQVLDKISSADVLVLLTQSEGFGLVIAEAMVRGTAVIASNVGALKELIHNGKNGLLVANTIDSVVEACTMICLDSKLALQLIENAKETMADFSIEKMCKNTEKIYLQ